MSEMSKIISEIDKLFTMPEFYFVDVDAYTNLLKECEEIQLVPKPPTKRELIEYGFFSFKKETEYDLSNEAYLENLKRYREYQKTIPKFLTAHTMRGVVNILPKYKEQAQ